MLLVALALLLKRYGRWASRSWARRRNDHKSKVDGFRCLANLVFIVS